MAVENENKCYFAGVLKSNRRFPEGFELKYTQSGLPILFMNLYVSESFGTDKKKFSNVYVPCRAFGTKAESFAEGLKLGANVKLVANFKTRSYENRDGEKVYDDYFEVFRLEVIAGGNDDSSNSTRNEDRREPRGDSSRSSSPSRPSQHANSDEQQSATEDDSGGSDEDGNLADINSDDIPF
jgi:single-strand DNA-binding protein